jgi:hypothetical protein
MRTLSTIAVLLLATLSSGLSQPLPNFSFSYRTETIPASTPLPVNGQVTLSTLVGTPLTFFLVTENRGTDSWTISRASVTGQAFTLLTSPPQTLSGGASATYAVRFAPTAQGNWTEVLTLTVANASGTSSVTYNFFVRGTALGAELIASYFLTAGGNQVLLENGGRITYPETQTGQTSAVTVVVSNRGTASGTVRAVALQGERFRMTGLPLLPATIAPDRDLRFGISFEPLTGELATGQLSLDLGDGKRIDVQLAGRGVTAALTFTAQVEGRESFRLLPGGTLQLPDTASGSTVTAALVIKNDGTAAGRIATISTTNSAFRLVNLPVLPATIAPGATVSLQVVFTARESGKSIGRLVIDQTFFELEAISLAPRLTYAVRIGETISPVSDAGPVIFPNVTVGGSNEIGFVVTNGGNAPAQVFGLSVTGRGFVSRGLPSLPLTLPPGTSQEFALRFAPESVGPVTGSLQIDERTLPLLGVGMTPGPVPGLLFTGLAGTVNSLEQPAVGVTLENPYGVDLTGRLTLSFSPDSFGDDPNIQFATGGRTVEFRVPAGSTEAVFNDGVRTIPFQAGTVAGTISLVAALQVSTVNVTPSPAPAKAILVASAPPVLRNVAVGTRSANSIELLVTGLSSLRSITQFGLQFTAAPGARLDTTALTVNVESAFGAWYQSTASRTFGSQFTASVTINVQGGDANALQSVAVTASNARGSSSPMSVSIR